MPSPLGSRLAKARTNRGWSLREVERRTGIHNAHLSQIETGAIERPDPNILWALASLYELDYPEVMRLAGHLRKGAAKRSLAGVALYALEDLDPKEQQEVLDYMARLKRARQGGD
jgi:transcriptional regulator with XRE-family HTH domain